MLVGEGEKIALFAPRIWFVCPPLCKPMPCDCFMIVIRYEDDPRGPGLDLDTLEIKPAQPLGGGKIRGGVDTWDEIRQFFKVYEDHAELCVPRRLWFPHGMDDLTARIANLYGAKAEAAHTFCVRPRRIPVFFG